MPFPTTLLLFLTSFFLVNHVMASPYPVTTVTSLEKRLLDGNGECDKQNKVYLAAKWMIIVTLAQNSCLMAFFIWKYFGAGKKVVVVPAPAKKEEPAKKEGA